MYIQLMNDIMYIPSVGPIIYFAILFFLVMALMTTQYKSIYVANVMFLI